MAAGLSFGDHARFQRTCLVAAAGAGVAAVALPWLLPSALGGAMAALLSRKRPAVLCAVLGALLAAASVSWSWALPLAGCTFALGMSQRRDEQLPAGAIVAACALGALVATASVALPSLAAVLGAALPGPLASALAGGALGLWLGAACLPLHVAICADGIEERLAQLRPSLSADLRQLACRAATARREALEASPAALTGDLRRVLDGLALAALDLARRGTELSRAAPPALEEELARRAAELARAAGEATDEAARASYQRAGAALETQLEHCRTARCARERVVARLHEDVAQLERARFALGLLHGVDAERGALELDLLSQQLQESALACEAQVASAQQARA